MSQKAPNPKVVGSNPTPATMIDEGLADAGAANPFRLPGLHPGIGFVGRIQTTSVQHAGIPEYLPGPLAQEGAFA
jgi:hypothetical protein